MIEITTGVMFLMSSLYGGGHATDQIANIQKARDQGNLEVIATTIDEKTLTIDPLKMRKYLQKQFADTPILVDVARCESNYKQFDANGDVIRGRVNKYDVGLMQINEKYHLESSKKLGMDIYTIDGNIEYAKHIYEEQGTSPWTASSKCWLASDIAKN